MVETERGNPELARAKARMEAGDFKTARAYKSTLRSDFFASGRYALIANIGDQQSDIEQEPGIGGGKAECVFKLPNPFYFIP